ncbi:hypothetical protein [Edaphobacter modestus]|nr:hypothetical protein [Edaphobacter modestus]
MPRGTKVLQNHGLSHRASKVRRSSDPDTQRLATLAAMTMARQRPSLVLPSLSGIPTSYTHTTGADSALAAANSISKLGLGSIELWKRHNGNLSLFIKSSINQWLAELGSSELNNIVTIDFAIVDELQGLELKKKGDLFILLETSDGCGFLCIGALLEQLENAHAGLGRAFYIVLLSTMNGWLDVYDQNNAVYFFDRWQESIEMDLDVESGQTFVQYCADNEINFPNVEEAQPHFVRDVNFRKEATRIHLSVDLLKKHRSGKFANFIEPVLAMKEIRYLKRVPANLDIDYAWDDNCPLPN